MAKTEYPKEVNIINPLDLPVVVTMTVRDLERIRLGLLASRRNLSKELEDTNNSRDEKRLSNIRDNELPRLDDLLRRVQTALNQFTFS